MSKAITSAPVGGIIALIILAICTAIFWGNFTFGYSDSSDDCLVQKIDFNIPKGKKVKAEEHEESSVYIETTCGLFHMGMIEYLEKPLYKGTTYSATYSHFDFYGLKQLRNYEINTSITKKVKD